MLDGAHALAHGPRDGLRGVGVRLHVAAEGMGLLHGGGDLPEGQLQAVQRVVGAGHATGDHDLDLVHALAQLLAHGRAHRVHAVDHVEAEAHGVAAVAHAAPGVGAPARVGVPAGGADGAPGDEQPRARQLALGHRVAQAPVGPTGVAHGGEAAVEHGAHERGGARGHQRQRHRLQSAQVHLRQHHVHVAVDEPGHEGAPLAVHHQRPRRLDARGGDLPDELVFHQHRDPALQRVGARVQQPGVGEEDLRHGRPRRRWTAPHYRARAGTAACDGRCTTIRPSSTTAAIETRKGGRVVECTGFEIRRTGSPVPRVRIPPFPPEQDFRTG